MQIFIVRLDVLDGLNGKLGGLYPGGDYLITAFGQFLIDSF